jgi:hypothetical protein
MFHRSTPTSLTLRQQPRGRNTAADHDLAAAITRSQPPAARGSFGDIPRYRRFSPANRFLEGGGLAGRSLDSSA